LLLKLKLSGSTEILKWKINRLILFLDKNDTPYITSKFFFDTCYLQQAGVPGPLLTVLLLSILMSETIQFCVYSSIFRLNLLLKLKLSGSTVTGSGCLNKTNLSWCSRSFVSEFASCYAKIFINLRVFIFRCCCYFSFW
jgi:hypothetical protein